MYHTDIKVDRMTGGVDIQAEWSDRVAGRYQAMVGGQTEYQTYVQADSVIGGYPDRLNVQVNREERQNESDNH